MILSIHFFRHGHQSPPHETPMPQLVKLACVYCPYIAVSIFASFSLDCYQKFTRQKLPFPSLDISWQRQFYAGAFKAYQLMRYDVGGSGFKSKPAYFSDSFITNILYLLPKIGRWPTFNQYWSYNSYRYPL